MRVVIIKEGEVVKSTLVKGSAHIIMKRMSAFMSKDGNGREIELVGDDNSEIVRFVHKGAGVEARSPVSNYIDMFSWACKARRFESLLRRVTRRSEEELGIETE